MKNASIVQLSSLSFRQTPQMHRFFALALLATSALSQGGLGGGNLGALEPLVGAVGSVGVLQPGAPAIVDVDALAVVLGELSGSEHLRRLRPWIMKKMLIHVFARRTAELYRKRPRRSQG